METKNKIYKLDKFLEKIKFFKFLKLINFSLVIKNKFIKIENI